MNDTPLSSDELAAAYLKSRDIPCPNCDYNRRDGVSAACPECGFTLAILHEEGGWKKNFTTLASRFLAILMVLTIAHALVSGRGVYFWLNIAISGGMPGLYGYFYLIQGVIGVIAHLTIFLIALRTRRKVRSGNLLTVSSVAAPMLAYLIVTLILWVSGFVLMLF